MEILKCPRLFAIWTHRPASALLCVSTAHPRLRCPTARRATPRQAMTTMYMLPVPSWVPFFLSFQGSSRSLSNRRASLTFSHSLPSSSNYGATLFAGFRFHTTYPTTTILCNLIPFRSDLCCKGISNTNQYEGSHSCYPQWVSTRGQSCCAPKASRKVEL